MNCPGCGAEVGFRSERAPYAVCSSCGQMLLRRELDLELLGQVAECQPDGTLLQLGSRGEDRGRLFTVSGRAQLRYGEGFWNEWFVVYDDRSVGWLGEALGQYFLSSALAGEPPGELRSPPDLGQVVHLDEVDYATLDLKSVEVFSFEGELPSLPRQGTFYRSVDLRSDTELALSVDYQTQPPTVYRGRWVDFSELALQNLRDDEPIEVGVKASEVRSVSCTGCGAPFELVTGAVSRTYVCQYCGNAMDTSRPEVVTLGEMVDRAQELAQSVTLKLGTEVHLPGGVFRLIGFCESSTRVDGQVYRWTEYLLYHRAHGYRWLSQTEYHFTLFEQLKGVPTTFGDSPVGKPNRESLRYQGRTFRHFQTSEVITERVVGEFYWRLVRGERQKSWDFISPPYLLSAAEAESDITWSLGRYLSSDELALMIPTSVNLKPSWSLAPNQPNPHQPKKYLPTFAAASVLAYLLVSSGVLLGGEKLVWEQKAMPVTTSGILTESEMGPLSGTLRLDVSSSDLTDRFVKLETSVVTHKPTSVRSGSLRMGHKGAAKELKATTFLTRIPASPGRFRIEAQIGPPTGPPPPLRETAETTAPSRPPMFHLDCRLTQLAPGPGYGSLIFALMLLSIAPVSAAILANGFEKRRWAESDYG